MPTPRAKDVASSRVEPHSTGTSSFASGAASERDRQHVVVERRRRRPAARPGPLGLPQQRLVAGDDGRGRRGADRRGRAPSARGGRGRRPPRAAAATGAARARTTPRHAARQQPGHAAGARRLAAEGDLAGVAAERADLALHPLEHGELVEHPPFPYAYPSDPSRYEKSRPPPRRRRRAPPRRRAPSPSSRSSTRRRAATRDRPRTFARGRRPDVEVQQSSSPRDRPLREVADRPARLRRRRAEGARGELSRPPLDRRGRRPPALPGRRGGVGDPEKGVVVKAAHAAGRQLNACASDGHRCPRASGAGARRRSPARAAPSRRRRCWTGGSAIRRPALLAVARFAASRISRWPAVCHAFGERAMCTRR